MDFALDLETLGLKQNSVIVNVGITYFDPAKVDSFDTLLKRSKIFTLDRSVQKLLGRIEYAATLEWWKKQGEEAKRQLDVAGNPPDVVARYLKDYLRSYGDKRSRIYCRGTHFDIALLESLFLQFNVDHPWHYRKPRCSRTVLDEWGITDDMLVERPENMVAHNSAADAAFEAYMLQRVRNGVELPIRTK